MPGSSEAVSFASSNRHKFAEASRILAGHGIGLSFLECSLEEIQSGSVRDISVHKARTAFARFQRPVIVEDDGLEIDSLRGFPGPYSSFVFDTIGNGGILKLVGTDRRAAFVSAVTYCDTDHTVSFESRVRGMISAGEAGEGWGYDPIFIPDGRRGTFAQLDDKNSVSHRYASLTKFSEWFLNR